VRFTEHNDVVKGGAGRPLIHYLDCRRERVARSIRR
jgi:hypothetical protein